MEIELLSDASPKNSQQSKKVTAKKTNQMKKLDLESIRLLQSFKEKVNKKSFGRKVKDSEILLSAIRLLGPDQIRELQQNSYSEQDRLTMKYEEYVKQNGKITLDGFIGLLIRGEIKPKQDNLLV